MPGFDSLIGKSVYDITRENLGMTAVEKVEQRLVEKYGINLSKASEEFPKLDSVLREFFGDRAEVMERKILQSLITIEEGKSEEKDWFAISDFQLATSILTALGDDDKKNIMNSVLDEPRIISDILFVCQIPQTSGYRKINQLIETGFLIANGYETTPDGKRVSKYSSIFENIKIEIEKNKVLVKVKLTKKSIERSMTLQRLVTIQCSH